MLHDILSTVLKSLISVSVLFILTRLMGKKQLSQLTFFDYVVGISFGSIAASFAVDPSIDYTRGVTGLVVYALFPIVMSLISLKSCRSRRVLDGRPTILVQNGRLMEESLKRTRLTVNDVLEECRIKNAFDLKEVEFAVLETDGRVSVLLKSQSQPLTPKDMNIGTAYKGLCVNVVIDGEILDDQLRFAGRDREWLFMELGRQGVSDKKDVLLGYIDSGGELVVHIKNSGVKADPFI